MKLMKQKNILGSILAILLFTIVVPVVMHPAHAAAGDLSYTKLKPQSGDDPLIAAHRAAVASAPGNYKAISTSGTTSVAAAALDRLIVNTAGSSDSKIVITDGTNALATVSTAAQAALTYSAALTTGTVNIVVTGTTAPNLTVITK